MHRVRLLAALVIAGALATGCGGTSEQASNPAQDMNAALAKYAQAQEAFTQVQTDLTPSTVTQAWLDDKTAKLARLRNAFEGVRSEAQSVDFPQEAGQKGQPAQGTVDEFIAATDALITIEENQLDQAQGCVDSGGSPYDCVMQVGTQSLLGAYPDILQRAQAAALQLQVEASRA
jgi:hypothetical protein